MSKKVRHVLGISGGKDSAALAIYLKDNYPQLDIEYYTADTGKELAETYELIDNLEQYLQKPIIKLRGAEKSEHEAFDHFLKQYKGYLPSSQARWCTNKLKLEPFERFIGDDPVISYVGIRGDEDREGYISKKPNIQSIFPFRQNIWSEDVIVKVLANNQLDSLQNNLVDIDHKASEEFEEILRQPIDSKLSIKKKANLLLNTDTQAFNKLVFAYLRTSDKPIAQVDDFPLVNDTSILVKKDIFKLLRESKVGVPKYYEEVDFELDGKIGTYARSRSGCYFCFFQQKIEWVWLYEQHPEMFEKAVAYEKEGYAWDERETLTELIQPERIQQIKRDHLNRQERQKKRLNTLADPSVPADRLLNILGEDQEEGCAACFI